MIHITYITLNHKSKSLIILSIYLPTITLFIYKINNNKIFLNRGIYRYIYIYTYTFFTHKIFHNNNKSLLYFYIIFNNNFI